MPEINDETKWLYGLLVELRMEQFYDNITAQLQVTRFDHFNYVHVEDLCSVGLAPPGARRLLEAVRKWRQRQRPRSLMDRMVPRCSGGAKDSKNGVEREPAVLTPLQMSAARMSCLIKEKDLVLGRQLGVGSFGVVHQAEWTDSVNGRSSTVAVKILKLHQDHSIQLENFIKEVQAMHQLSHRHIVTFSGVVLTSPMMIVTELAPLGNLRDYIRKQNGRVSLSVLHLYAMQVASGMVYLSQQRLVHGDVACRNLLLVSTNLVKIGDFGLMGSIPEGCDHFLVRPNTKVPVPWCAPETLSSRQLSHASDVWMFGVCVWEMVSFAATPWPGLNDSQILNKLTVTSCRLQQPLACSDQLYQLLLDCWHSSASERPNFSSIHRSLVQMTPRRMKATGSFSEPDRLDLSAGDRVVIIDGLAENYWWRGQSQSTWLLGTFPRHCVTTAAATAPLLESADVSQPLENSFIHTGHGSPTGQNDWGSPAFIDQVYLRNPMECLDKRQPVNAAAASRNKLVTPAELISSCQHQRQGYRSLATEQEEDVEQWHVQHVHQSSGHQCVRSESGLKRPSSWASSLFPADEFGDCSRPLSSDQPCFAAPLPPTSSVTGLSCASAELTPTGSSSLFDSHSQSVSEQQGCAVSGGTYENIGAVPAANYYSLPQEGLTTSRYYSSPFDQYSLSPPATAPSQPLSITPLSLRGTALPTRRAPPPPAAAAAPPIAPTAALVAPRGGGGDWSGSVQTLTCEIDRQLSLRPVMSHSGLPTAASAGDVGSGWQHSNLSTSQLLNTSAQLNAASISSLATPTGVSMTTTGVGFPSSTISPSPLLCDPLASPGATLAHHNSAVSSTSSCRQQPLPPRLCSLTSTTAAHTLLPSACLLSTERHSALPVAASSSSSCSSLSAQLYFQRSCLPSSQRPHQHTLPRPTPALSQPLPQSPPTRPSPAALQAVLIDFDPLTQSAGSCAPENTPAARANRLTAPPASQRIAKVG